MSQFQKTEEEALQLDEQLDTSFWLEAIKKEKKNVIIPFDVIADGEPIPVCYKKIECHMVFELMQELICNARIVAEYH